MKDYILSDKYRIRAPEGPRKVGFGDIAIICRNTKHCRMIMDACESEGIPAYLQGEVQIMSTREGKLALAWLRFVNNDRDPWAIVPIMADMGYPPVRIRDAVKDHSLVPANLIAQRNILYRKRRRITELLTTLFQFYHLDNDITQSIITTMSTIHRNSLLTISDVIRIIEDDIENNSTYPVENFIDTQAVTIMTMHKSKGLEFPIVICPFIDIRVMPGGRTDNSVFLFNERLGIRCTKEIGRFDGYSKICNSWRYKLAASTVETDYSEERRLMFVSLSRAKQYETLICGPQPSYFMKDLSKENYSLIPEHGYDPHQFEERLMDMPIIPDYPARRTKIGVHEILDFSDGEGNANSEGSDEVGGKGMDYGTEIHKLAELMCKGRYVDENRYPELPEVRKVLDSVKDADLLFPEEECNLPIDEVNATLRGVIDLMAIFPDHVEIHDYKTDVSDRFESEYIVQLSVYSYVAQQIYDMPVDTYIDYVSQGISKRIDIVPMDCIVSRVRRYLQ